MTHLRFDIIYADPPWPYNKRNNKNTRFGLGTHGHYEDMTFEDIKRIPVSDISSDDSVLFLWTTFPKLKQQLEVIEAWGFDYKTVGFTWIKTYPKAVDKFVFGTGFYAKSNAECCLLATRGRVLKPVTNGVSSLVVAPISRHSQKSDEVRARIDKMYPHPFTKVELFARINVGQPWVSLGYDIDGKDIFSSIEELK